MDLTPAHEAMIKAMKDGDVLTEHHLATAVSKATKKSNFDVTPEIGKYLIQLKEWGLVWCGQMYNAANQFMWSATLTSMGKKVAGELTKP